MRIGRESANERKVEWNRERETERESEKDRETDIDTDREIDTDKDRETESVTYKHLYLQTNKDGWKDWEGKIESVKEGERIQKI